MLRWVLVPHFTKDLKACKRPINARSETAGTSGGCADCLGGHMRKLARSVRLDAIVRPPRQSAGRQRLHRGRRITYSVARFFNKETFHQCEGPAKGGLDGAEGQDEMTCKFGM